MPQNFAQYFRALQILFFALLFGQIAVTGVLLFINDPTAVKSLWRPDIIVQIIPVILIAQAGLAFFLNRRKLETARSKTTIKEKLGDYRAASIMKWAPLEAGTLLSAILFFISGEMTFIYFAAAMIVIFATQFPSRQRLIDELDLSANEQMILDDPNAEVAEIPNR